MAPITSLSIVDALTDVPFQAFLDDFEQMKDTTGIPTVATKAEFFAVQSTTADIGVYPISTNFTAAEYDAHVSSFVGRPIPVVKKAYVSKINLKDFLTTNLGVYREDQGGFSQEAVMAICNFVGAGLSKSYLTNVMSSLQADLVSQISDYPTHYTTGLAGKICWDLTAVTPPAGQTKIIDYLNQYISLMPSEMKWGGRLSSYMTAYVSQDDFETMKTSLASAYQFQSTGGFEQTKHNFSQEGALTLDQVQIMNANARTCHILFGNIAIIPVTAMQDDTMILTYQKRENKTMYYEKIPHTNKQNLYFGIQGDFAYQPKLTEPIYKITETPYSLPLTAGRMFLSNPHPFQPMMHNLNFFLGSAMVVQDNSRVFCLFPN